MQETRVDPVRAGDGSSGPRPQETTEGGARYWGNTHPSLLTKFKTGFGDLI